MLTTLSRTKDDRVAKIPPAALRELFFLNELNEAYSKKRELWTQMESESSPFGVRMDLVS